MKTVKALLKKVPDDEDVDAFSTLYRILEHTPDMEEKWINVILTRFHCKPLSYYINKYLEPEKIES
jgi:uncharacterized damage-inducible protein DinB